VLDELPEDKQAAVRNNLGGHVNHSLFWEIMCERRRRAERHARQAIDDTFEGGLDELKAALNDAGVKRFGSGCPGSSGTGPARVYSTANQDSPTLKDYDDVHYSGSTSGSTRTTSSTRTAPGLPGGVVERRDWDAVQARYDAAK